MKKLLPERRREKPQIMVTNLIDVILLLVFFFMITSSFAKDTRKIPLELPHAGSAAAIEGETLTFQIDRDGKVLVGGALLEPEQIAGKVAEYVAEDRNRTILVEADQALDYGLVIGILDRIRSAGGVNLGLSTRPTTDRR